MAENTVQTMSEEKFVYLESAEGKLCRIPAEKAEAWKKAQEERHAV